MGGKSGDRQAFRRGNGSLWLESCCPCPHKILIVNPNTTASMTETMAAAARAVAAAGTEILPSRRRWVRPRSKASMTRPLPFRLDPGAVERARRRCRHHRLFRRTGLDAARSAALSGGRHLRGGAGDRRADGKAHRVVTTLPRSIVPLEELVRRYGFAERATVTACNVAVLDLEKPGSGAAKNSRPRSRGRWKRARRPSCSVAPGWPISRQRCRRNSRCPCRWRRGGGETGRGAGRLETHDLAARRLRPAGRKDVLRHSGEVRAAASG